MVATTFIPVEEYLTSMYHPDMDYVDGRLEERNMGEREHGELQGRIYILLKRTRKLFPFIETRMRVSATRYRIPDICAYTKKPDESVFTQPPLLCVEILSPEDRLSRIRQVAADYIAMGVQVVWILDPLEKRSYIVDADGFQETFGPLTISWPSQALRDSVVLTREEIFSDSDLF